MFSILRKRIIPPFSKFGYTSLTTYDQYTTMAHQSGSPGAVTKDEVLTHLPLTWAPWTAKSEGIAFETQRDGIGDGEDKLAAELDTVPYGQNSSYDMDIILDGVKRQSDAKKLDNGTFNTGVKGRDALRPIKTKIDVLLETLRVLESNPIFSAEEKAQIHTLSGVSPDEMCVKKLLHLNSVIKMLKQKQDQVRASLPTITYGLWEMTVDKCYAVCETLAHPIPADYVQYSDTVHLLKLLTHDFINDTDRLNRELNALVSIFTDIVLVFVDRQKGYSILKDLKNITFQRITRGNPRFRVL